MEEAANGGGKRTIWKIVGIPINQGTGDMEDIVGMNLERQVEASSLGVWNADYEVF